MEKIIRYEHEILSFMGTPVPKDIEDELVELFDVVVDQIDNRSFDHNMVSATITEREISVSIYDDVNRSVYFGDTKDRIYISIRTHGLQITITDYSMVFHSSLRRRLTKIFDKSKATEIQKDDISSVSTFVKEIRGKIS